MVGHLLNSSSDNTVNSMTQVILTILNREIGVQHNSEVIDTRQLSKIFDFIGNKRILMILSLINQIPLGKVSETIQTSII